MNLLRNLGAIFQYRFSDLGKRVIKGTRLTVELILQKLSEGASAKQLIVAYPSLQVNDILAVLAYAKT